MTTAALTHYYTVCDMTLCPCPIKDEPLTKVATHVTCPACLIRMQPVDYGCRTSQSRANTHK